MSAFPGVWGGGSLISENGNILTITMGNRPNATGTRHSETNATVNFPDDRTLEATLVNNDLIQWSNNTTWKRL